MGLIQSIYNRLFNSISEARVLMVGLDNAGKTTILYKLQLGEVQHTIPTIGMYGLTSNCNLLLIGL